MNPLDLFAVACTVAYFAHVIPNTDGAFDVFLKLRERFPDSGLLTCPYCLAPYIAGVSVLLLYTPLAVVVYVFAAAGLGLMASAWTGLKHL